MLNRTAKIITILVLGQCSLYSASAQDTIPAPGTEPPSESRIIKSPHRATMLAAALPGMGQVYNRKYWKIPLVYAGFAGLGYGVWFNSSTHIRFTRAFQDFTDLIPETDSYRTLLSGWDPANYDPVLHPDTYKPSDAQYIRERLLSGIDYYKKYRDLSYIGIAAWYLLSILDANVDASLSDYDIGESINLSLSPAGISTVAGQAFALNVKITKTF
jgi:hypothetical protein